MPALERTRAFRSSHNGGLFLFTTSQRGPLGGDVRASGPSSPDLAAIVACVPAVMAAAARTHLALLLATARSGGMANPRRLAYVLATAQHEADFGARLVDPSDDPSADDARFRGRGYVRIAGRATYAAWSRRLGLPDVVDDAGTTPYFVAHPDAVADRSFAARIFVRGLRDGIFTGVALGSYINDRRTDFVGARKAVRDDDRAHEVAASAQRYLDTLVALDRGALARTTERDAQQPLRLQQIDAARARLARDGHDLPPPVTVVGWRGQTLQGRYVRLDETTYALHTAHGEYVVVDILRDLGGVAPPEATKLILRRTTR